MDSQEEVDIYGSLPEYDFDKKLQELEVNNKHLMKKVKDLEGSVDNLKKENSRLVKRGKSLDRNISALYSTALAEIEAKNKQILELQREKDSILFRRHTREQNKERGGEELPCGVADEVQRQESQSCIRDVPPNHEQDLSLTRREDEKTCVPEPRDRQSGESSSMYGLRHSRRRDNSWDERRREDSREDRRRGEANYDRRRDNTKEERTRDSRREERRRDEGRPRYNSKDARKKEDSPPPVQRQSRESREKRQEEIGNKSLSRRWVEREAGEKPQELSVTGKKKSFSPEKPAQSADVQVKEKVAVPTLPQDAEPSPELPVKETEPALDPGQDTSTESNSSSSKENSKESKLLRAERLHQKKVSVNGVPEIAISKEIKKISPLRKTKSPKNLNQSSSTNEEEEVGDNYKDLLSTLLQSEKERINKSFKKKKKKIVAVRVSPRKSPITPGKFLVMNSSAGPKQTPKSNGNLEDPLSISPEMQGVPETPGKSLLLGPPVELEASPSKLLAERKEIECAVFSILPTPLKLIAQHPLISPLHNTPVCSDRPAANNKTPEPEKATPIAPAKQASAVQPESPQLPTQAAATLKSSPAQQAPTSFPFKRKRVLKIKCTSGNNSSLGDSSKNESSEEPPAKKVCPPQEQPKAPPSSLFSPPKQPEPKKKQKVAPTSISNTKPNAVLEKAPHKRSVTLIPAQPKKSVAASASPIRKITTPKKPIQAPNPASVSSTGRKSNDSCNSQDFHLHYTSDSEMSRSPSPYLPQSRVATSTPHPNKRLKLVADPLLAGLTPNSKKKQKRRIVMSEMFGESPRSEREYHLDLDVDDDMRRELQLPIEPPKNTAALKKKAPSEDANLSQRSKSEHEDKRPLDRSRHRLPSRSPEHQRRRSPVERRPLEDSRRRSPEERRRSPEDRERRRVLEDRERRRSPEERERRRSPEERSRRRSPEDRRWSPERRRSPDERERRRYADERRRSPDDRDRRFVDERRRSPEDRTRRRSPDDRDRKYRRSRSLERAPYSSSSRRSPGYYSNSRRRSPGPMNSSSRRSPSPRDRRSNRDHSLSPEEKRRYKRQSSRSLTPPSKHNGTSRNREPSPRRRSPEKRTNPERERCDRSLRKSNNSYDDRRGGRDSREKSSEEEKPRESRLPVKDLRNLIVRSRSKSVKKAPFVRREAPAHVNEDADSLEPSEEGEIDSN